MYIRLFCLLVIASISSLVAEELPPELPDGPVYAPIVHQPMFRDERVLFGYAPRFEPNVISFDHQNRPLIRTNRGTVQHLQEDGSWTEVDLKPLFRQLHPDWKGAIANGPFLDERIVVDEAGYLYTHFLLDRNLPTHKSLLCMSSDGGHTWAAQELPIQRSMVMLQYSDGLDPLPGPPAITFAKGSNLWVSLLRREGEQLVVPEPVLVSDACFGMGVPHSGGGNYVARRAGKAYVVYAGNDVQETAGTAQYIVQIDEASGTVKNRSKLGINGHGKPDPHNLPTLTLDDAGYLHVLLGSHHDPFGYTRSLKPLDIAGWEPIVYVGVAKRKMGEGSYTYVGLLHNPVTGDLHLIARWAGDGYKNRLVYLRKRPGKPWTEGQVLVEPFKPLYGVWYHKLSMDLHGRLFLNYRYLGSEFTKAEALARMERYPDEPLTLPEDADERVNGMAFFREIKPQGACLLISEDHGDSWRLAVTDDIQQGVLPAPAAAKDEAFSNSLGMQMVPIQPGQFHMGSATHGPDERPVHSVAIGQPFYLAATETRVADFRAFVDATDYKTLAERTLAETWHGWLDGTFRNDPAVTWQNPGYVQTDEHPVTMVTIEDIQAFIVWLSEKEGRHYRLPTEAEWEYACRAGTRTAYSFGEGSADIDAYGWYAGNAQQTLPVAQLKPNPWGLYDMHGNLWEYCADYYADYLPGYQLDPAPQPANRAGPVIRGGSWIDDVHGDGQALNLRSASRYHVYYPRIKLNWVGFRLACDAKPTR